MSARTEVRVLVVLALLLTSVWPFEQAAGQGRRKEVEPKKAVRDADPSFSPIVAPGTTFTYRVSLKQGRRFVPDNGDGVEVTQTSGNIAVGESRRVSATIFEVDFASTSATVGGSASVRINFTNKKGRLKFVRSGVAFALPGGGELVRVSTGEKLVVDRVASGSQPVGIGTAGTPAANFLYAFAANSGDGTVSVVDLRTTTRVATVPVGSQPTQVAVAGQFGAQFAYVTNSGSDDVSVVDAEDFSVVGTIPVGDNPQGITLTGQQGARQLAWVANQDSDTLTVIDTVTNTVLQTLAVGDGPAGVATAGRLGAQVVVVALANANAIVLVDVNSSAILATVPVGTRPSYVVVGGAGASDIFVVNQASGTVTYFDLNSQTVLATIPVGAQPTSATIAGASNAQEVYVTNRGDGTVSVISVPLRRTVLTIPIGGRPRGSATIGVIGAQDVLVTN